MAAKRKTPSIDDIDALANPATRRRKRKGKSREEKSFDSAAAAYHRALMRLEDAARTYAVKPGLDIGESRDLCRYAIAYAAAHYAFTRTLNRARKGSP